jgi:hypothetical protein
MIHFVLAHFAFLQLRFVIAQRTVRLCVRFFQQKTAGRASGARPAACDGSRPAMNLGGAHHDATAVAPSVAPPKIVAVVGSPIKKIGWKTNWAAGRFVRAPRPQLNQQDFMPASPLLGGQPIGCSSDAAIPSR